MGCEQGRHGGRDGSPQQVKLAYLGSFLSTQFFKQQHPVLNHNLAPNLRGALYVPGNLTRYIGPLPISEQIRDLIPSKWKCMLWVWIFLFFPVYLCSSSLSVLKVTYTVRVNILPPVPFTAEVARQWDDTPGINGHYYMPYHSENTGLPE